MLLKHIKSALILLLCVMPLFVYGVYLNGTRVHLLSRGNYFFDLTRNRADVASIQLIFPNKSSIQIEKIDDFWRIKEADGYYTAFAKINALISLIRNTVIYRADTLNENEASLFQNPLKIISRDTKGNIIDDASIAPLKKGNKYYYALLNGDDFLYQLNSNFELSSNVMDWVQMPLFAFNLSHVKRIKTDNFEVYRRFDNENFKDVKSSNEYTHLQKLIDNFWYLSATEIKQAAHFNVENLPQPKQFFITLFNGIIYEINLYSLNNEYWVSVRLNREGLINKASLQQIKENSLLYDGWFFKIDPDKGAIISEFVL